tara:strand:- start:569 stop:901 length:333 start_codon:yes stop_codon:yes gene_type:complete
MNFQTGRADHIEDYLITVRTGQWFTWTDTKNKIYSNLKVLDGGSKPSEADVNAGLKKLQDDFDAKEYSRKREVQYPSLKEQLDLQYWDQVNGTTKWKEAIAKVKSDNPKP